ncbi:aminoglycoside phosphotransferase family protein [Alkaliphilus pronyensis]|nr:aminoglycoside phosphotransferase family protein [Alkaliphilus pronyensis]
MGDSIDTVNKEKIVKHFGNAFFTRVEALIEPLIVKWDIVELRLIEHFSANLVFKGKSNSFGSIILKFGRNPSEFRSEVAALKSFKSKAICQLLEVDFNNMVLIEEAIEPGLMLKSEKDIDVRLDVFCNLFKELHSKDKSLEKANYSDDHEFKYKSYKEWVFKICDYMDKQASWKEVALHMKRAKELYIELSKVYSSKSLLHGDFHYYNILKGKNDYMIIDPKGVIGDPIFDIPRYVLNEFCDQEDDLLIDSTIEKVFNVISKELDVPKQVLSKLLYIEGTMAVCWNIEDGMGIDKKEDILKMLNRLYRYLN